MSTEPRPPFDRSPLREELHHLREHWLLLFFLGVGITLVGAMAIVFAFITTLATVTIFGSLLFVGGVIQLVNAVTCRNWRGFVVYLLAAILAAIVGLIMMNHPLAAAAGLTLMLAAAFMIGGTMRIVVAAVERFHGWPWVMANGFISLFLGIYIWRHFPEAAFWVIGLFVGADLLFAGLSWIMLAIGIRGAFPKNT
jgi:uncharacterized membrane protein HdeD (DUF308 family)